MKPRVICLMAASVDGRTLSSRWRPKGAAGDLFERVHDKLSGDAWLIGRGAKGAPSVFDSTEAEIDQRAPITTMTLESSQAPEGGAMLPRYRIQNALSEATGQ
jgi:hypothetical protein